MEPNQGIKTWQWVVTVIVIIILIVLGYYLFKGNGTVPATTTDNATTTEPTAMGTNEVNRVMVSDQYPGNVVYISSAQFGAPGWVTVQKDNKGTPGAVIGTMYFDKGINPGKITLSEKTVDRGTYYAVLHSDDGDKKFDAAKDLPLKDSNGSIIMKIFHATTNITETKG